MIKAISSTTSRVNSGKCPHGMPLGACPICKGMQGGGGMKSTGGKAREMTWDECYAIGQILKAQSQRSEEKKEFQVDSLLRTLANNKIIQAISEKVTQINNFIQSNMIQPVVKFANRIFSAISKPIKNIFNKIANSALGQGIKNASNAIKKGFINISDKIAATIGEPMSAVAHFLSENWRKLKPKKFIFFDMIDTGMEQGDSEEEVELKRILYLKTFKDKLNKLFNINKGIEK